MKKKILAALLSLSLLAALCVGTAFAEEAAPTNDSLICDGVLQTPTVYKINGSNYFKIRDLAAILNGSAKQFSVGYDADKKSVTANTGAGYLKQPTDLTGAPAGGSKSATASSDAIYINGVLCQAEVYKIDGMNYFKLRDLGQALDFGVGWDSATGTVTLDTTRGYNTQPQPDNSQAAMARAMLDVLARERGANGGARLVDVDGDGVKELLLMGEMSVQLYTWKNGRLEAREVGELAGGQMDWKLCKNAVTGERGIQYRNVGGSYDNRTFYYPTRQISLSYSHSDDGSSDFQSYYIDNREVSRAEYNTVWAQNRILEDLLDDYYSDHFMNICVAEVRAELECLAAGKTARDISDAGLMVRAELAANRMDYMFFYLAAGGLVQEDRTDSISAVEVLGANYEDVRAYRAIGCTNISELEEQLHELWYQTFSRKYPTFDVESIKWMWMERNGGVYVIENFGMGDRGGYAVIDRMVSRTAEEAVFRGHWSYGADDDDTSESFEVSLVFEDGVWKYGYYKDGYELKNS